MPSSHLILCRPLLLLPLISPSIRVFSNESTLRMRWSKYWSFSFSIILAVQGTLKSLSPTLHYKHINSLVIIFLHSPTLISIHDYWKNHSLDWTDLCCKVMSLLLNMLSRLVITFLPRSKRLSVSWLQSPSAVILEPPKIVCHCFNT